MSKPGAERRVRIRGQIGSGVSIPTAVANLEGLHVVAKQIGNVDIQSLNTRPLVLVQPGALDIVVPIAVTLERHLLAAYSANVTLRWAYAGLAGITDSFALEAATMNAVQWVFGNRQSNVLTTLNNTDIRGLAFRLSSSANITGGHPNDRIIATLVYALIKNF